MTKNDIDQIRGVVREEINTSLEPINEKLDTQDKRLGTQGKKLDALWDQVVRVSGDLEEVKEILDSHTTMLKSIEVKTEKNSDDIKKVDKRLMKVESRLGIVSPPELTIIG